MKNYVGLIFLFLLLFMNKCNGQKLLWEKHYIADTTDLMPWDMIETEDGQIAILKVIYGALQGLLVLDKNGDSIYTKEFPVKYHPSKIDVDMYVTGWRINETLDNNLIVTGILTTFGFDNSGYIYYRKMKKGDGELISDLWYLPGYPAGHDRFASEYVSGVYGPSCVYNKFSNTFSFFCGYDAEFTKSDSTGKILTRVLHDELQEKDKLIYTGNLILTKDGGYMGTCYYVFRDVYQTPADIPIIVRLDSVGKLLWKTTIYDSNYHFNCCDIKETKDGGCIALVCHNVMKNYYLYKLNKVGEIEWHKEYTPNRGYRLFLNTVIEDKNGGYTISYKGKDSINYRYFIDKVSQSGKEEWSYELDTMRSDYFGYSFIQLKDGNYLLAGEKEKGHLYVAKIEPLKLGVEEENKLVTIGGINLKNDRIEFELGKSGDVEIEISNSIGERIKSYRFEKMKVGKQEFKLNLNEFTSGVYLVRIRSELSGNWSVGKFMLTK